jgi:hypothetical protein
MIKFSMLKYFFAHNKTPRGQGSWIFECGNTTVCINGTLTEAKRGARTYFAKRAKTAGVTSDCVVHILP